MGQVWSRVCGKSGASAWRGKSGDGKLRKALGFNPGITHSKLSIYLDPFMFVEEDFRASFL